jgi:hypothetical protein
MSNYFIFYLISKKCIKNKKTFPLIEKWNHNGLKMKFLFKSNFTKVLNAKYQNTKTANTQVKVLKNSIYLLFVDLD